MRAARGRRRADRRPAPRARLPGRIGDGLRGVLRALGWSSEKFRKVAQRARARLRSLLDAYNQGERCQQLQPALLAVASQVADPAQAEQVGVHLQTCLGCARTLRDLRAAERGLAALLPAPLAVAKAGLAAKLAALGLAARRLLHLAPGAEGSGGAVAAGGSALGAGAAKLGVTALCVAGAAGGYAVCNRVGVLPTAGAKVAVAHHHRGRVASGSTSPIASATSVGRTTAASSSSARRTRPVKRASKVRRTQPEFSAGAAATARTEFSAEASAARATRPAPSPQAPAASREFAAPRHPEAAASEFGG